jgi:hypothetical protein
VLVLITKWVAGCRGIRLVEVIWKVLSSIIYSRLKNIIDFHDLLNVFKRERGAGTAIIKDKLQIQASIAQSKTLFQVFIDFLKAYHILDIWRTLDILRGERVGVCTVRILKTF